MASRKHEESILDLIREQERRLAHLEGQTRHAKDSLGQEQSKLDSVEGALKRERNQLAKERQVLENFHRELLEKERRINQSHIKAERQIRDLRFEERDVRKSIQLALNELNKINKELQKAQVQLEGTALKDKAHEGMVKNHMSQVESLNAELKQLRLVREELSKDLISLEAIDDMADRIDTLIKLGDVERAAQAYDALRATYPYFKKSVRKKSHSKLLKLHHSLAGTAQHVR